MLILYFILLLRIQNTCETALPLSVWSLYTRTGPPVWSRWLDWDLGVWGVFWLINSSLLNSLPFATLFLTEKWAKPKHQILTTRSWQLSGISPAQHHQYDTDHHLFAQCMIPLHLQPNDALAILLSAFTYSFLIY